MKYLPCDSFTADILAAEKLASQESGSECKIGLERFERIVERIELLRESGTSGETHIDRVLGEEDALCAFGYFGERLCYRRALELILRKRLTFRTGIKEHARRGRYAPFAPR